MFQNCTVLKKAPKIPDSVRDCSDMFCNCVSLEEVPEIPYGVENCSSMFMNCKAIKTAGSIPDSVTNCYTMFNGCVNLETPVDIPAGAYDCGYMFAGCKSLKTTVEIPDKMKPYGYSVFHGCDGLGEQQNTDKKDKYSIVTFNRTIVAKDDTVMESNTHTASVYDNRSIDVEIEGQQEDDIDESMRL